MTSTASGRRRRRRTPAGNYFTASAAEVARYRREHLGHPGARPCGLYTLEDPAGIVIGLDRQQDGGLTSTA
jgi:hypothetical protein